MTRATLLRYLKTEALAAQIAPADINDRVNAAIEIGIPAFWGAWNWYFKRKQVTFSVTATATSYDAPDDFGGLVKIVEQDSTSGGDLAFFAQEEFNRLFPKPAGDASGRPVAVTCFMDAGDWKLQFYPRPNVAMDFDLVYEIDTAHSVEEIPKGFEDGVVIWCAKYIPRMASSAGLAMEQRAQIVLRQLQLQNNVHKKPFNSLAAQSPTGTRLPVWADPNASIL